MSDNVEIDSGEDPKSNPRHDFGFRKRMIVLLLLGYSALLGVIVCFLPTDDTQLGAITSLPLLVLGIMWCSSDAAERHHRIGRFTMVLLIFLFVVGLPIYLFQSRGIAAFKPIAFVILLAAAMCLCMFVTAFTTLLCMGGVLA